MNPRFATAIVVLAAIVAAAGFVSPAARGVSGRPPSLAVAAASRAQEADVAAVFNVHLSRTSTRAVSVRYATANGSAHAGSDYGARRGMLVFRPGQKSKQVRVSIVDDAEPEPEETFVLRLSAARGAGIRISRATGIIAASDLPAPFILRAELTGADQLPGPGSRNGRGTATVTLDPARELASFTVSVFGVERPTEAGIGRGRRGEPPTASVLRFTDQFPATGTLTDSRRLELIAILELYREPEAFFVEVRSATGVGAGGIRGQLTRVPAAAGAATRHTALVRSLPTTRPISRRAICRSCSVRWYGAALWSFRSMERRR